MSAVANSAKPAISSMPVLPLADVRAKKNRVAGTRPPNSPALFMQTVPLDNLKSKIAAYDVRPHLAPLLRFRGSLTIHRAHSLWNFANAMMMSECDSLLEGVKLYENGEVGHLCGMHAKAISRYSLGTIFNRIRQSPKVAAIQPGIAEYSNWVNPYRFDLQEIGKGLVRDSHNSRVRKKLDLELGRSDEHFYPFISRNSKADHALLATVHAAVPRSVHHSIRADVCQDLICAVLAGDIQIRNIREEVPGFLETWAALRPKTADEYYKWGVERRGGRGGADSWKEEYVATEYQNRSFEERFADLQDHFGCSEVEVEITVTAKNEGRMSLPPNWLNLLKAEYPSRRGDHGWGQVPSLVQRAILSGVTWERLLKGTQAYRMHCDQEETTGTPYVKQARTFYGPARYFEEWADMAPVKTAKQTREQQEWEALKLRGKSVGFRDPHSIETPAVYETALKLHERHVVPLHKTKVAQI